MITSRRNLFLTGAAISVSGCASAFPASGAGKAEVSTPDVAAGELIYANALKTEADIADFKLEGEAYITFENERMRMRNKRSPEDGQEANFVFWCPEVFPRDCDIRFDFRPIEEPGLCVLFFGARGLLQGQDVHALDERLAPRAGVYNQYTESDLNSLQISYFRRRWESERAFHLVNMRRAPGFEMLAQGADPLPDVEDMADAYRIRLWRKGNTVRFFMNDLEVMSWIGEAGVNWPEHGSVGFRQMAPLVAEYANLEVRST